MVHVATVSDVVLPNSNTIVIYENLQTILDAPGRPATHAHNKDIFLDTGINHPGSWDCLQFPVVGTPVRKVICTTECTKQTSEHSDLYNYFRILKIL